MITQLRQFFSTAHGRIVGARDALVGFARSPRDLRAAIEERSAAMTGALFFMPGIFFLLLGAVVVLAPSLVLGVLAAVFAFLGVFLCLVAWKFLQLRARFDELSRELRAQIVVHGVSIERGPIERDMNERELVETGPIDTKKIVYH